MTKAKKTLPKQIGTGVVTGVMLVLAVFITIGVTFTANAKIIENNALNKCGTLQTYNNLIEAELIDTTITREKVEENCTTIKARTEALLKEYGSTEYIPLFITDHFSSFCGEMTIGCVQNSYGVNDIIPAVMSISVTADYYDEEGLAGTVAHEYVHVLTSADEYEKLMLTPSIWTSTTVTEEGFVETIQVSPDEGVADCGRFYFTGSTPVAGSYMSSCTPEQTEIAYAVIENRY